MTLDETIARKIDQLPTAQRRNLLHFIDRLASEANANASRRDPRGSLRSVEPLTQDHFDEIRHLTWSSGSDS